MGRDGSLGGPMLLRLLLLLGLASLSPAAEPAELDSSVDGAVSCLQRHAANLERPAARAQVLPSSSEVSAPRLRPEEESLRRGSFPGHHRKRHEQVKEMPEMPVMDPCGKEQPFTGFARLSSSKDDAQLPIDLTEVLQGRNTTVPVLVTAMSLDGAYSDEGGFDMARAQPLEDTESLLLTLRLSKDGQGVDFYRPSLSIRTSDNESQDAVRQGLGDGWLGSLDILQCTGNSSRVVISGAKLIWAGFFVASIAGDAADYRLLQARGYAKNFDVSVEYLMSDMAPLKVGFSVVLLPEVPMAPRPSDDRLLFFATDFQDLGYREARAGEPPSHEVDRSVASIWRYNLQALPNRTIRVYVDLSVPARWREAFRQGIEAWDAAFAQLGLPGTVRAVVPGDEDWPKDYDMSDARFSTISWDLTDDVVSMGISKVDPRSGEIVKSDITMSSGWVKAWLEDIDSIAPGLTHLALPRGPSPKLLLLQSGRGSQRSWRRVEQGRGSRAAARKGGSGRSVTRSSALNSTNLEELLAAGLRAIVMHETGHILGLRHNFKGSLGISLGCLKDKSCTSQNGLSASVMDYVPPNLQNVDVDAASLNVDVFNPVIGGYDMLAIAYGYRSLAQDTWPKPAPELQAILNESELSFQVCYDEDMDSEDPTCMAYDMSEDPMTYFEQELDRYVAVSKQLLEASVAPGEPLGLYGEAVGDLLDRVGSMAEKLVSWVGGIQDRYVHRGHTGDLAAQGASRKPISRGLQQRALALLLRLLRPASTGLLPPKENLPFLVQGTVSNDHVQSLDLPHLVHDMAGDILDALLDSRRLLQIYRQQHLVEDEDQALSLDDVLRDLVGGVLEPGLSLASLGQDLQPQEMDLHVLLIRKLKDAYFRTIKNPTVDLHVTKRMQGFGDSKIVEVDPEQEKPELPQQISSKLLYFLQSARQLTKNTLEQIPIGAEAASFWQPCSDHGGLCGCDGLVRLAQQGQASMVAFSPAVAVSGIIYCNASSFPKASEVEGELKNPDSWCECLSLDSASPSDLRTHLALLHREFADVFCEAGPGCSEALVSLPLAPSPPAAEQESPYKSSENVRPVSPGARLPLRWFIIGICFVVALIFASFMVYRHVYRS